MVKPRPQLQPAECADILRRALSLHQSGQLAEAEKLYAAVLVAQPDDFDALHHTACSSISGASTRKRSA
jgi:hypothetical protein